MKAKVKLEKKIGLNFQDLILALSHFWVKQGCVLQQPYDTEVGAGTMHPETFLRVLGSGGYRVVGPPTVGTEKIRIVSTSTRSFR